MPPDYSIQELARRLDEVVGTLEGLVSRLDATYLRRDLFDAKSQTAELARDRQSDAMAALTDRVAQLEDDKKWLVRLVLGFIVLAVLGAVFAAAKVGGH